MDGDTRPPQPQAVRRTRGRPSALSNTVAVLLLIVVAFYVYERLSHASAAGHPDHAAGAQAATPPAEQVDRPIDLGSACDGRTQCSQMTSCAEAKYFLQNCPGVQMDSNRGGVPCEKSWCNAPQAK